MGSALSPSADAGLPRSLARFLLPKVSEVLMRACLLLVLLLALPMAGCSPNLDNDDDDSVGDDDDTTGDDDDVGDDDDTSGDDNGVRRCEQIGPVNFDVIDWSISGDLMEMTVGYSGGCEDHDFQICWDGAFMESWPVQASLVPQDYGPPDPCLAFVTETHTFDLTPLSDAWSEGYGAPPGEIIINMSGSSVSYTF